jgi:hypothetical protein
MRCSRIAEGMWEARGLGATGTWHLLRRQIEVCHGSFDFFSDIRFLGSRFRASSRFTYRRVNEEEISYLGRITADLPAHLRPFCWLARGLAAYVGSHINRIGGEAAAMITANPGLVAEHAGEEAARGYEEFRDEEAAIRRGVRHSDLFTLVADAGPDDADGAELTLLKKRLQSLESRVAALATRQLVPALSWKEFHGSLDVFAHDARTALVTNRRIVERVARLLFQTELQRPPGTRMLGELLDLLGKEARNIPSSVLALMRAVNLLGAVGAHVETGPAVSIIDESEYGVSFGATIRVTEWFLLEYLGTRKIEIQPFGGSGETL